MTIHIILSGRIYRIKFLHKPSSFSPWRPSVLVDLPLPGDTFCRSCTRKGYLLPPSLAVFYGGPTQSPIQESWAGGSSSFLPGQLTCSQAPHPAAAQPLVPGHWGGCYLLEFIIKICPAECTDFLVQCHRAKHERASVVCQENTFLASCM